MTTIAHEIANRLASGSLLTSPSGSGGLGFDIYERPLAPGTGPGATPEAFDASRGNRLKRSIVVLDGGEVDHPARQMGSDLRRWDSFPTIHIWSEAHTAGKQAAQDAYLAIESLLIGWETVVAGQRIGFRLDSRVDLADDPEWPGNVRTVARVRATGVRQLAPV